MNIKTIEVSGFQGAFKGMRNPMNSWSKSDSGYENLPLNKYQYVLGENDLGLTQRLINGGSEHCKFRRMIQVWADFDMPRYWWSEFDTYKIGTSANSCSTMHRLLNNKQPITKDLFVGHPLIDDIMDSIIERLEEFRRMYMGEVEMIEGFTKNDLLVAAKRLLPEGFLQLRTVNLNYETIANIYHQRKHHRLKEEWIEVFCSWVESLPYAQELIIAKK